MKRQPKTWLVKSVGVVAAMGLMVACGQVALEEEGGEVKDVAVTDQSISVAVEDAENFQAIYGSNYSSQLLATKVQAVVLEVLSYRLRQLNIDATTLPEFTRLLVKLDNLSGCSISNWGYRYATCTGAWQWQFELVLEQGGVVLDRVNVNVPFNTVSEAHFRVRAIWAIDTLVDQLAAHGTLPTGTVHTPYF